MLSPSTLSRDTPRNVVIMGCGRLGASIAVSLAESGSVVHIMDTNPDTFGRLPEGIVNEEHVIPIHGDGTRQRDLIKSGIQDTDVFIAVCGRDTRNALAAQIAQHIFDVPKVICRMNDPVRKEMYERLGILTVSGTKLFTEMVTEAAQG